ncbi:MAG: NAD(+)/NADH kinase [Armatimonadetes bacterium]|nr:NAD(+)/NADH kinase [Armatimonadota bacterium]
MERILERKTNRVGIVLHPSRAEAVALAQEVESWLNQHGIEAAYDKVTAERLNLSPFDCTVNGAEAVDFIVTLGGDGTILTAARMAAPYGIPILGVHKGKFGFIAEIEPARVEEALDKTLKGEASIQERLMVQAEIVRDGEVICRRFGLNEVMVKSGMSHLMALSTSLGGTPFARFPSDGIVIATPTGSTAYALSAGGPLVMPTVEALLMVPICPHTLNARPMLLPKDETIEIEIESEGNDMFFAVDGIDAVPLLSADRIRIQRSEHVTRLLTFETGTFYRKVRARYLYGERVNE